MVSVPMPAPLAQFGEAIRASSVRSSPTMFAVTMDISREEITAPRNRGGFEAALRALRPDGTLSASFHVLDQGRCDAWQGAFVMCADRVMDWDDFWLVMWCPSFMTRRESDDSWFVYLPDETMPSPIVLVRWR